MTQDPARSRARAEYQDRADALLGMLRSDFGVPRPERTVIAVAGESGSGKSVTAIDLAAVLNDAGISTVIVHQDNYFVRPPRTNHEHRLRDISSVGVHEVQTALIQSHITAFRNGASNIAAPIVNYPENRFDTQALDFSEARVLMVEGTYALLLDDIDLGIFLQATYHDTAERRRKRARDIDDPFVEQVLEIEHRLIAPQGDRADILIDRDFGMGRRS